MRRTRLRVPQIAEEMVLVGAARRHLRVMRLGVGDVVEVFDGAGKAALATVESADDMRAVLALSEEETEAAAELPQKLTLAVALLKGDKLADVVRAATELGAAEIQLLSTEHGDVPDIGAAKLSRLARIAEEAAKQSRRAVVPVVHAPVALQKYAPDGTVIVAHVGETRTLNEALHWNAPLTVVTGPEGGFSEAETERLREHGAALVGLGPRVLRAETAPVALLGAIVATGV